MKKVIIISPHFPPSNLAAVHRSRLFVQHLPSYGWEPVILTVHENFYEEALDHHLEKLLPSQLRIEKANAFRLTKPRLVGDIGLRGFFQLYKKAKEIISKEKVDFLFIHIPSFYVALLGRWLHKSTGIPYGIDYIDPWVHTFPGSDKIFSRHWLSTLVAKFLEPIAVKKASLITGVAAGYYTGVIERNPHLLKSCLFGAMPYGGEKTDHDIVTSLGQHPYLFQKKTGKLQLVYAGAMLPKAYDPLENIFKGLVKDPQPSLEIHFIGTGKTADDPQGYNIKYLAEKFGLWQTSIYEYPKRIPYLDVLVHLNGADGIFILGSTEPHYTPSKVYQGILSGKPILAVLHEESTAVKVLKESGGGIVLEFGGEKDLAKIEDSFVDVLNDFFCLMKKFDPAEINKQLFEEYSASAITQQLAILLNKCIN